MSQWEDQFTNHPVHAKLTEVENFLKTDGLAGENINALSSLTRISDGLIFIRQRLKGVNPTLAPLGSLNNSEQQIQALLGELTNFNSNKNVGHLANGQNYLDAALRETILLPAMLPSGDLDAISQNLVEYRKATEQFLKSIKLKKDTLGKKIEQIATRSEDNDTKIEQQRKSIENQTNQLNTLIAEWQKQYSTSEGTRVEQFNAQLQKASENFIKTTEEADNNFVEARSKIKTQSEKLIQETQEALESLIKNIEDNSNKGLNFLEEKKVEASNLLEAISTTGLTGNYQRIANQEETKANIWRRVAMILMIIAVFIIGVIAWKYSGVWQDALFKMSAVLILGFPAKYAIDESKKHRENEQRNRRAELELAALDPYLEKLPDSEKTAIKSKFAEKFFGAVEKEITEEVIPQKELLKMLQTAVQNLTKNK